MLVKKMSPCRNKLRSSYQNKIKKNHKKTKRQQSKDKKKHKKNIKKKQNGGVYRLLKREDESVSSEITSFKEFVHMIDSHSNPDFKNGTMLIGVDYKCEGDLNRGILETLQPDFCWAEHPNDCKGTPEHQWYQLYFPFQIPFENENHDFLLDKNTNKFNRIIFDASTSKFLFKIAPSFLALLYYYFLQPGGELYVDFKENAFSSSLTLLDTIMQGDMIERVRSIREITRSLPEHPEFVGKKFIIPVYSGTFTNDKRSSFEPSIHIPKHIIIDNNIAYLRTHLIGSRVELIEADEQKEEKEEHGGKKPKSIFVQPTYPIPQTNYSIGSYLKITRPIGLNVDRIRTMELVDTSIFRDSVVYNGLKVRFAYQWIKPLILRQSFDDAYPLNCIFI